ncbi:hypothetical protein [Rhizobium leguminosarum]|uniref:hypothetical protein n=1 Tax=Rhizobium leguminosarum TaxID=384 RepID=UPI00124A1F11|nr:hypothetical protein [Rhizobium leguminosarum]
MPDYEIERFQDLTPEQQAQRPAADPQTPRTHHHQRLRNMAGMGWHDVHDHPRSPHAQAHHAALFEALIGGSPMPTLRNVRIDLDPVDRATITAALIFWRDAETRPDELEYLSCGLANSPPSMRRVSTSSPPRSTNGDLPGDDAGN